METRKSRCKVPEPESPVSAPTLGRGGWRGGASGEPGPPPPSGAVPSPHLHVHEHQEMENVRTVTGANTDNAFRIHHA